jgi:hypothetical protein
MWSETAPHSCFLITRHKYKRSETVNFFNLIKAKSVKMVTGSRPAEAKTVTLFCGEHSGNAFYIDLWLSVFFCLENFERT